MRRENSSKQIKIGILLNYVNIGFGTLIPIFYTPIMLFLLGQNEYGLYKLASSATSYLSLMSFGIGAAVTRYLIKANTEQGKEAEERIFGLFVVLFSIISIVTFIVGSLLTINLDILYETALCEEELNRMKILVFLMVCNTSLSFSISPYISIVSTHEKFIFLQCMNIITTCFGPILNIIVLYLGYASIGMTVATLSLNIISRFVYLYYVRKIMGTKANYKKMPIHLLKEIIAFSFWVFLANIVNHLYNTTDVVLIGAVPALATSGVAIYSIGATFNNILSSLSVGISSILTPKTNRMVFEGSTNIELTDFCIRVGRIQCYIVSLIIAGFIVFGRPFINFYVGLGYEESYWIAVIMMIPNMIPLVQSVCLNIIIAQNKHKFRAFVYLCIAILNVIGTWILVNMIGTVGAALMTGISLIIGQGFIMNWYYWKKTGLEIVRFWKELGKIFVIPICMILLAFLINDFIDLNNLLILLLGIIIFTLIYCVLNYKYVMNSYEKDLIIGPLKKFKMYLNTVYRV